MSKMVLTCFFVAFLCIFAGCLPRGDRVATGEQGETGIAEKKVNLHPQPDIHRGATASQREGSFPDFLVGRWKAADANWYKWGFKFEKDGTISVMRNSLDMYIIVSEGGIYEPTTDPNKDSACTLGPVEVSFDPNGRILTVKVVTDYFMLRANDEVLEGSSIDKFVGPVSEDGLTWNAEWQSVSRMLDGPPMDFNNPTVESVVFYKVREESK